MNENLNLEEILKDCPEGTELYSTIFGKVKLDYVEIDSEYPIYVKTKDCLSESFSSRGELYSDYDGECTLFPSREQRDWSKFNHPKKEELVPPCEFKDGDILSYQCGCLKNRSIYIYRYHKTLNTAYYVALSGDTDSTFRIGNKGECALNGYDRTVRFATEEEKQKLFDAIKENGYKWNAETKTLEKLVEPKFKVGDWVVFNGLTLYIKEVVKGFYRTISKGGIVNSYDWNIDNIARLWVIQDAKDGDVLVNGSNIFIFYFINNRRLMGYCHVNMNDGNFYNDIGRIECFCTIDAPVTPATKEQRDILMKAMNDAGYVWDEKKNELRELIKHKFDPKTLQPFDKVLVRYNDTGRWKCAFYSHGSTIYKYTTANSGYMYCIPYNDETKHLLGTTDEAPEFYRYWED